MTYEPPRRSDGTIQNQRVQAIWPADKPFRVLSIDGGGIAGILSTAYLAELETRFLNGDSIAEHFDMIAGTSTGGIIALGLAHGLSAQDILRFYIDRGGAIFPPVRGVGKWLRKARHTARYIYDPAVLEVELRKVFGDAVFGSATTRLVIPSYEGRYGEPWIYKTPHHRDFKKDRHERMVNVAMATTAAPTYLPAFRNNHYCYVDGGIWANNPVMNAVVDALSCFAIERRQLRVLSLGCGETVHRVDEKMETAGVFGWRYGIKAAIRAQSKNALGQTFLLLGKDNVVRVDAPETSNPVPLDDHRRAVRELPPIARALAEANGHLVHSKFLNEPAGDYVPRLEGAAA